MAIFKPDFEESNYWPEDISRIDRRDPNRSLADRVRARFEERRKITEDRRKIIEEIFQLSDNNWGFIKNTAPAELESDRGRINRLLFTKQIDRKRLNCRSDEKYWSYIQIVNLIESNKNIQNQTLVFMRYSRAEEEEEPLLKFKNIKSGEAFVWDGKYSPEWKIVLRKRNGDFYCYHGEIYLRDPENPIKY